MENKVSIWYYVKSYKFNSLFIKNLILIILLVIMPLGGVSLGVYSYFNRINIEEINSANSNDLSRVRDMVDVIFKESDQMTLKISMNKYVQKFMTTPYSVKSDSDIFDEMNNIIEVMNNSNIIDAVDSIYSYSEKSNYIISSITGGSNINDFRDKSWLTNYLIEKDKNYTWAANREMNRGIPNNVISIYRNVNVYDPANMGAIVVNLDLDKFGQLIGKANNTNLTENYVIDEAGKIIYSSNHALINKNVRDFYKLKDLDYNKEKYEAIIGNKTGKLVLSQLKSKYNNLKFVSILTLEYYNEKLQNGRKLIITFILIAFLMALVAAFIISVKVFEPVKNIIRLLENPNEFLKVENVKGIKKINELKYIISNISRVFDSNKKMEDELIYRMSLLKKAETKALQSQINPHFLYNTLETINWMSIELNSGGNKVSEMIANLSKLLRISLGTEENLISIEKELEHANIYLKIQEVRYEDMLNVAWEMDNEILHYKMVKLTLQPLIENAIYHGIKPSKRKCLIKIKGCLKGKSIVIEISDNGVGMSQDKVNALNEGTISFEKQGEEHIGLKNVNLRNKLILGDEYVMTVSSEEGKGTTFTIVLPKIE